METETSRSSRPSPVVFMTSVSMAGRAAVGARTGPQVARHGNPASLLTGNLLEHQLSVIALAQIRELRPEHPVHQLRPDVRRHTHKTRQRHMRFTLRRCQTMAPPASDGCACPASPRLCHVDRARVGQHVRLGPGNSRTSRIVLPLTDAARPACNLPSSCREPGKAFRSYS